MGGDGVGVAGQGPQVGRVRLARVHRQEVRRVRELGPESGHVLQRAQEGRSGAAAHVDHQGAPAPLPVEQALRAAVQRVQGDVTGPRPLAGAFAEVQGEVVRHDGQPRPRHVLRLEVRVFLLGGATVVTWLYTCTSIHRQIHPYVSECIQAGRGSRDSLI